MVPKVRSYDPFLSRYRRPIIVLITAPQPKSGICVCSSHTKVSHSSSIGTKKRPLTNPVVLLSVPLLDIIHNVSTAQQGLSTSLKLGIAFGSIIAAGFFAGLLIMLYLILYHRLRARSRARSWKRHLNLRKLYLDRGSNRDSRECNSNNSVLDTDDGPVTVVMVGTPEESPRGGGRGGGDTLTDPFAAVFSVPPPPS